MDDRMMLKAFDLEERTVPIGQSRKHPVETMKRWKFQEANMCHPTQKTRPKEAHKVPKKWLSEKENFYVKEIDTLELDQEELFNALLIHPLLLFVCIPEGTKK